jgi:hypothetical protein
MACDAHDCDVSYGFFVAREAGEYGLRLGLMLAYEEFESVPLVGYLIAAIVAALVAYQLGKRRARQAMIPPSHEGGVSFRRLQQPDSIDPSRGSRQRASYRSLGTHR